MSEKKKENQVVAGEGEEDPSGGESPARTLPGGPSGPVCVPASLRSFSFSSLMAAPAPWTPPITPLHLGPAAKEIRTEDSMERGAFCSCWLPTANVALDTPPPPTAPPASNRQHS